MRIPDYLETDGTKITGCKESDMPKNLNIPDGVTEIGSVAFNDCTSLESVTISNSVTKIGQHAFDGCTAIRGMEIPDSVTEIGSEAFHDCSALRTVGLTGNVTKIGSGAFGNCGMLDEIEYSGTKEQWGKIEKGDGWHCNVSSRAKVRCTDGEVDLDYMGDS